MERVSRVFKSHEYSPDQRKVFPFARCTPSLSILRDFQNSNSDSGKSSPTTPTSRTGEKKLALSAAYEADPPIKSLCSSTGVLTVTIAMRCAPAAITSFRLSSLIPPMQKIGRLISPCTFLILDKPIGG